MKIKPIEYARKFMAEDIAYLTDNHESIRDNNSKMLRTGAAIYLLVLFSYTLFNLFTKHSEILIWQYIIFDTVHVCFCVFVFLRKKKSMKSFRATQCICAFFEVSILLFFLLEAVLPFPQEHALYIPIAIVLVIIVYIHSAQYTLSMIFLYTVSYAVLAYFLKSSQAFENDLRIAIATFVSSVIGYVLLAVLRHDERIAVKKLEYMSMMDPLTGVYNKQTMEKTCDYYLKSHRDQMEKYYSFMIIDIDNFKHYNDVYGHNCGDEVLRRFGDLLQSCFEINDFVGRFGGDEFVVMIKSAKNSYNASMKKINTLLSNIKNIRLSFCSEMLSCSVGIVFFNNYNSGFELNSHELLIRADKALYKAKSEGKNRFCVYANKL